MANGWLGYGLSALILGILVLNNNIENAVNAEEVDSPFGTNYSDYHGTVNFTSSANFKVRGMEPFYNITNMILKWFEPEPTIPEGYLIVEKDSIRLGPKAEEHDYADLLKKHWGLLLVVLLSALVVVLMPVIGLCFCCCRCCGGCGGRTEPFDKKHDTCRRVFMGMLLVLACTGMVFGVVLAFMTNYYMQQGIRNITVTAREGVSDAQLFLNATSKELNYMLVQNYGELMANLNERLDEEASTTVAKLEQESNAVSLEQLNDFVQALPKVRNDLERTKFLSTMIRTNASDLNTALRAVKNDLLQALKDCNDPSCKDIETKYKIGELDANGIDYDRLPDVTDIIRSVDELISGNLMASMSRSKSSIDQVKGRVTTEIDGSVQRVKDALTNSGKAMQQLGNRIDNELAMVSRDTGEMSEDYLQTADKYIKEYGDYRYYLGLGISSLLLLILICVICGLLCGICGKRPDGYGDDCCNKGAGGRFLMIGVAIIFLTLSALTLATLIHFLVGLVAHRVTCVSLRNPTKDSVFKYIDQYLDPYSFDAVRNLQLRRKVTPKQSSINVRLSDIIHSCHLNKSSYDVFRLEKLFNISEIEEYPKRYNIEELLKQIVSNVEIDQVVILDADTTQEITRMARSRLSDFDIDKFRDNLNDQITKYNLTEVSEKLSETAKKVPAHLPGLGDKLAHQALQLKLFDKYMVQPMVDSIQEILQLSTGLDETLRFGHRSFPAAIDNFVQEARKAETFINSRGTAYLQETARNFTTDFMAEIDNYLNRVITKTQTDVARCGPISNVYNSTVVATCNKIVDPINGFWAGVGWCLLLFFPTIILAVKLSSLYQKSDPYPGPNAESEYLYDAYSERDNIPLATGPKNKRRKDRRRDHHREYYEDSSSSHGPPSSSRDARHWDNSGPPRYQNPSMAPSEYERPPPYYYPGASNDD